MNDGMISRYHGAPRGVNRQPQRAMIIAGQNKARGKIVLLAAMLACTPDAELPVVAVGHYVEIATNRDEDVCGGTAAYMDRVIEAAFTIMDGAPPEGLFVRFEWLEFDEQDPVLGGGVTRRSNDGVLIQSDYYLVEEHELVHAVQLQTGKISADFLFEGLAILLEAKRPYAQFPWESSSPVTLDEVVGAENLPNELYPYAWFIVSQIVRDHGFDGLRQLWDAVPYGATAGQVRAAYEAQFGQSIDVLLDPAEEWPSKRLPCYFALCPTTEPIPWDDSRLSVAGPRGCADDPDAIGPDRRDYLDEYGEVWRQYDMTLDPGTYDISFSPNIGANIISCEVDCEEVGVYRPGFLAGELSLSSSQRQRVEVRAEIGDLPTQSPGMYTVELMPPD